jgi:hypothetical protein
MLNRAERSCGHIRTETGSKLLRGSAVENICTMGKLLDTERFYGRLKANAVKSFRLRMKSMTVLRGKKSLQIPVPAVAVIQEWLALFVVTGRKGQVNGFFIYLFKKV